MLRSSIRGCQLAIFVVDMGTSSPPPEDDDESFSDSWPVVSAGEARFDTGPPGKVYGAPGECARTVDAQSLSPHAPEKRRFGCTCFETTGVNLYVGRIEHSAESRVFAAR